MTAYKKRRSPLIKKKFIAAVFAAGFFIFLGFSFPFSGIVFSICRALAENWEKETVWHIKTPNEVKGVDMTSWGFHQ